MKKICFILTLCICVDVSFASCSGSSLANPISDDLVLIDHSDGSKNILGVINTISGDTVIEPQECDSITADEYVIFCHLDKYSVRVYKHDGEEIGNGFELFSYWNQNGEYYLGTNYKKNSYYFPQTEELINLDSCGKFICASHHIFIKTEKFWEIRKSDGKLLSQIPHNACIVCLDVDINKAEIYIITPEQVDKKKTIYIMRDINNNEITRFTEQDWLKQRMIFEEKATFITDNVLQRVATS